MYIDVLTNFIYYFNIFKIKRFIKFLKTLYFLVFGKSQNFYKTIAVKMKEMLS